MPPRSKKLTSQSSLLEALKFLSLVTSDKGNINETNITLSNNYATCFNGILAAGHKIDEGISACPQNKLMAEALSKCGQDFSIQISNNQLSIKSGKFKALVPCIEFGLLQVPIPDQPIAEIDFKFKQAIEAMDVIPSEESERIIANSFLMNGQSVIATDGKLLIEYWHGINLPPNLAVPKSIIKPLLKTSKKLVKFGYSQSSVTFWFEDESWLRSQLWAGDWPNVARLFDQPCEPDRLPPDFFVALAAVAGFSEGLVYFGEGSLQSHREASQGASYDCQGLPSGPIYNAKLLGLIQPYVETADFGKERLMFFGPNVRGILMGVKG